MTVVTRISLDEHQLSLLLRGRVIDVPLDIAPNYPYPDPIVQVALQDIGFDRIQQLLDQAKNQ